MATVIKTEKTEAIIGNFIYNHPNMQIARIVYERDSQAKESDLTVYFKDSPDPWGASEFELGSLTREALEDLQFVLDCSWAYAGG